MKQQYLKSCWSRRCTPDIQIDTTGSPSRSCLETPPATGTAGFSFSFCSFTWAQNRAFFVLTSISGQKSDARPSISSCPVRDYMPTKAGEWSSHASSPPYTAALSNSGFRDHHKYGQHQFQLGMQRQYQSVQIWWWQWPQFPYFRAAGIPGAVWN